MIDIEGLIKALKKFNFYLLVLFIYKVMKKFIYYVGIDVSKLKLDLTILYEYKDSIKTDYMVIENNEKSIAKFVKGMLKTSSSEQILFCFEDTGVYSFPLAYHFSKMKLYYWKVPAIEIKRSKGLTRGKSDRTDSKDIAFYAYSQIHKFSPSVLSPEAIQKLRLLFTEREKVIKALSMFGSTGENRAFIPKGVYQSLASINRSVMNQLNKALENIESKMLEIIEEEALLKRQYELLQSIPGIGMHTAIYLLIVTKGFDSFDNWRQLACYAGVAPFPYQSGTSIHGRTKVHPLADKKLKSLLNMCAMSAIRFDKELKAYYERKLSEGKPKMLIINNVRCKLLARVFAVVKRETPFVNTCKFAS